MLRGHAPAYRGAYGSRGHVVCATAVRGTLSSAAVEDHQRLVCDWCKSQNPTDRRTCATCGAPLDGEHLVSDSGWREAPRLRDMTEFAFGASSCQVEGEIVPVAELSLGGGDHVYFEHHVMLWKEPAVAMSIMPNNGWLRRRLAGMPHVISVAHGPGRVALSRDATGEMVVLPLHPTMELDVREHAFLAASHQLTYSFVRLKGLTNMRANGMFMDRFVTGQEPGLLLLHGNGNVLERTLGDGEQILIEPGGFLYKDSGVRMETQRLPIRTGFLRSGMLMARMTGPGRVGIQSMYVHRATE